jgi:hypothetical protein
MMKMRRLPPSSNLDMCCKTKMSTRNWMKNFRCPQMLLLSMLRRFFLLLLRCLLLVLLLFAAPS